MKLPPPLRVAPVLKSKCYLSSQAFSRDGKLHLEVDDSVSRVVMPPHRVPVALKGRFREEIDRIIVIGVLNKSRRAN